MRGSASARHVKSHENLMKSYEIISYELFLLCLFFLQVYLRREAVELEGKSTPLILLATSFRRGFQGHRPCLSPWWPCALRVTRGAPIVQKVPGVLRWRCCEVGGFAGGTSGFRNLVWFLDLYRMKSWIFLAGTTTYSCSALAGAPRRWL